MTARFLSRDGNTALVIEGTTGKILDASTDQAIASVDLRGEPLTAAISNNQKFVATAIRVMLHTDIYQYQQTSPGKWAMTLHKRLEQPPQALAWEEPDDTHYPPMELVITHSDGKVERQWVK